MKPSREWIIVLGCLVCASVGLRFVPRPDDTASRLAIFFHWDEEMFETAGYSVHYSFELAPLRGDGGTISRYQAALRRGDRVVELEGTLRGDALEAFVISLEKAGVWSMADGNPSWMTLCAVPPWYRFTVRLDRENAVFLSRPDDAASLDFIDAIHASLVGRLRTELLRRRPTETR